MSKIYLVWNARRTQCAGFSKKEDADQAAGNQPLGNPCSCLAEQWREIYADGDPDLTFEVQEVDLASEEQH